jgi:hypothetical protein
MSLRLLAVIVGRFLLVSFRPRERGEGQWVYLIIMLEFL